MEVNVHVPAGEGQPAPVNLPEQDAPKVRRARIDPADIADAGGYTTGCPGCEAMKSNKRPQPHKEDCRKKVSRVWQDRNDPSLARENKRQMAENEDIAQRKEDAMTASLINR